MAIVPGPAPARADAQLAARGLDDDSVIVVTSDHGENFDDHPRYRIGHGRLRPAANPIGGWAFSSLARDRRHRATLFWGGRW